VTTLAAPCSAPDASAEARPIVVAMGRMGLAREHEQLRTIGLGSCIAVVVLAPTQRLAALAHCMLPAGETGNESPEKFVDSAVPSLLSLLHTAGATAPFAAALVGGASMFPGVTTAFVRDIAGANIAAARDALAVASIPVRGEDVGGCVGRSVLVDAATQRVMVRTIRDGERWL
jgi:chemotaxis protein CheD